MEVSYGLMACFSGSGIAPVAQCSLGHCAASERKACRVNSTEGLASAGRALDLEKLEIDEEFVVRDPCSDRHAGRHRTPLWHARGLLFRGIFSRLCLWQLCQSWPSRSRVRRSSHMGLQGECGRVRFHTPLDLPQHQ